MAIRLLNAGFTGDICINPYLGYIDKQHQLCLKIQNEYVVLIPSPFKVISIHIKSANVIFHTQAHPSIGLADSVVHLTNLSAILCLTTI